MTRGRSRQLPDSRLGPVAGALPAPASLLNPITQTVSRPYPTRLNPATRGGTAQRAACTRGPRRFPRERWTGRQPIRTRRTPLERAGIVRAREETKTKKTKNNAYAARKKLHAQVHISQPLCPGQARGGCEARARVRFMWGLKKTSMSPATCGATRMLRWNPIPLRGKVPGRRSWLLDGAGGRAGKKKRREGGTRAAMRKMYAYGSAPLRVLLLG